MSLNDEEFDEERLIFIDNHVSTVGMSVVKHMELRPEVSKKFADEILKSLKGS